jgi:apolipoprotein N-acyltransferase
MLNYRSDERYSQQVAEQLAGFVQPLLERLDRQMDKRLVRTFLATLQAIITFRHSQYGLLLSELGAYVVSPAQAPAGTKRVSNLLRSRKWKAEVIEDFLWEEADAQLAAHRDEEKPPLVVWDESVVEKAETLASEDLGSVRSRRVALLKRTRPGFFFNPPGDDLCSFPVWSG